MLGNLNQDILGTSPKYPPINNLDYLTVDPSTYDNYPSDNNSVRIQPKLADLWNHNKDCGVNLVPNQTIQPLGLRNADEDKDEVVANFCREIKKAMMMGHTGKELAEYLRARFDQKTIEASKEEMVKLSKEQGLMGNVYIDASAFYSSRDAEQFLTMHRNRLAQDILINDSLVNPHVISLLANRLHKNVVANISYDGKLFDKYKAHLVSSGRIDSDYVIDSKESLRMAFLTGSVREVVKTAKVKNEVHATKEEIVQELNERGKRAEVLKRLAAEDLTFRDVRPIIEFTRMHFSKGKTGSDLKEMLRGKYASDDLCSAAKYIAVVISKDITSERIDKLVETDKISEMIGKNLKNIIKTYPLKIQAYEETKPEKQVGTPGRFYVLSGKVEDTSEHHLASVEALRKGETFDQVKDTLLQKLSNEEADKVLLSAVKAFNEAPAGIVANAIVVPIKKKVVADLPEPKVLPDSDTIIPQVQEFMNFYKGAEMIVDVGKSSSDTTLLDIQGLDIKSGIDSVL